MPRDFTNVRDLSQFGYCPLCGEAVTVEKHPDGHGERIEATCPEHGLLNFPHAGLDRPSGGRPTDEGRQRWADGSKVGGE